MRRRRLSLALSSVALPLVLSEGSSRCENFGPEFYAQAERDFAPFHHLDPWDLQRTKNVCRAQGQACFVVQIVKGRVYISHEQAGFQSRNRLTMAMLHRVASKLGPLPDAEFVVDTSDGFSELEAPLFVIAKFPQAAGGILYPDFSSYAWPESECPGEPPGSHVWAHAAAAMEREDVPWEEKEDALFWRGAATSVYRKQVLGNLQGVQGANVSFMEWVIGPGGERQTVKSGACVPLDAWCRYKFLANLPGNTMALSLKYRLLCGSVVVSPPLWYHEWYYSQLIPGLHYVEVDPLWTFADAALSELRQNDGAARALASASRAWARKHLSDDAFDCYWRRLIELAHEHFPPPQLDAAAVPVEHAMLAVASKAASSASEGARPRKEEVDAIVVIPCRVSDSSLMEHARQTWLRETASFLSSKHFFLLSAEDPDLPLLEASEDVLVVPCAHGYRRLLQKMAAAYRLLLDRFDAAFFIRADVDSVLPLPLLFTLAAATMEQNGVVSLDGRSCGAEELLWSMPAAGGLVCQTECAVQKGCRHFSVDSAGNCSIFAGCSMVEEPGAQVYEYRLRSALSTSRDTTTLEQRRSWRQSRPFIIGSILHGYKVLVNDTYNPQWNNLAYTLELGLTTYPPYPEASGYVLSAALAAYLAAVGHGELELLQWKAWNIEDAALGTLLAGLDFDLIQLPLEVRNRIRVIRVRAT